MEVDVKPQFLSSSGISVTEAPVGTSQQAPPLQFYPILPSSYNSTPSITTQSVWDCEGELWLL